MQLEPDFSGWVTTENILQEVNLRNQKGEIKRKTNNTVRGRWKAIRTMRHGPCGAFYGLLGRDEGPAATATIGSIKLIFSSGFGPGGWDGGCVSE